VGYFQIDTPAMKNIAIKLSVSEDQNNLKISVREQATGREMISNLGFASEKYTLPGYNIVILLDTSASMKDDYPKVVESLWGFIKKL